MACISRTLALFVLLGPVAGDAAANDTTTSLQPVTACGTTDGTQCIFPFVYDGVSYNSCTRTDGYKAWCSTEVDADGNYIKAKWGRCDEECLDEDNDRSRGWKTGGKHDGGKKGRKGLRGDADDRDQTRDGTPPAATRTAATPTAETPATSPMATRTSTHPTATRSAATPTAETLATEDKKDTLGDNRAQSRGNDGDMLSKTGVLVAVCVMVCFMFCCFTAGMAFLAFRLGRKGSESRMHDAMSSNLPLPQVTGSPVIVDVEAFADQKNHKVFEP